MQRCFAILFISVLASAPALAQKTPSPILPGGKSNEPVTVNAAKLDYFDKDQKLVYSGGVVATQGQSTLSASMLTIFLTKSPDAAGEKTAAPAVGPAPSGNSVRRMEAAGPVTIRSNDQIGSGDRGVYDKPANTVTLTGHVKLAQGPNITEGDVLTYNLTTSRAIVSGHVRSLFTPNSGAQPAKKK